ncbi:Rpr2-domain-containing protein [Daldinia caldariorum]|uniref:Rpr2-domain-containing protein n=1 Tax=Daldinia caldariorum TaxID=326644 RepID=UPI002008451C|nr:Rpr2-domain-containing protein [Daldinia caldariorum]KAI1466496.1 Rpr2-domain-containing protein [Daldinia caldariorum]
MGKPKGSGSVPNRPVYSRISYLYQAATYLASQSKGTTNDKDITQDKQALGSSRSEHGLSRRFITDLRSTSLKSQIRLSPSMKHTICKFCDSLLIEGETSSSSLENRSKGGKKPWAETLVVSCHACGGVKRFPLQAPRQKRQTCRAANSRKEKEKEKDQDLEAIEESRVVV